MTRKAKDPKSPPPHFNWVAAKIGFHLRVEGKTHAHVWPTSGGKWWGCRRNLNTGEHYPIEGPFSESDVFLHFQPQVDAVRGTGLRPTPPEPSRPSAGNPPKGF